MSETFERPDHFDERVVVYGTTWCGYCVMAKRLLKRRGIPFAWVNVGSSPDARVWLQDASGQRTVPQIFIDQRSIGGCSELHALDAQGGLEGLERPEA